jgi:CRP/FNR family transcriptional regulator, cyclic AMP receptor protein
MLHSLCSMLYFLFSGCTCAILSCMITSTELRALPLFVSLDDPTLLDLGRRMRRCTFRAGQHISLEGEVPAGVFFVLSGRVRLSRTAPDGREQVLATVGPSENFDLVPVLDGQPCPSTARAMNQVECLLLPRDELQALIYRHPDLALAAMQAMARQLRELVDLVEDLAFRSVRARLARQLLSVAGGGSAAITQQELAERAGTIREMAGRALRRMADEGLVRLERGRVVVLDAAGLRRAVEG